MGKRLYVGNLPYETTEAQLKEMFGVIGPVTSAKLIIDRTTGQSRGFGFVEMGTDDAAVQAIAKLHGSPIGTRKLTVNEARPMEPRGPGSAPVGRPPGGFGARPSGGGGRPSSGFGGGGGFGGPSFGPDSKRGGGRAGGRGGRGGRDKDREGERGGGRKGGKPEQEDPPEFGEWSG